MPMRNINTMKKILILVAVLVVMLGVVAFMGYRTAASILAGQHEMFETAARPAIWITDRKALAIQNRRFISEMLTEGVTMERVRDLKERSAELQERLSFFKLEEDAGKKKNRMRALPG